jgi:predicted transcriptional regulator
MEDDVSHGTRSRSNNSEEQGGVTMAVEGVPAGGINTIGQVSGTHTLRFRAKQTGLAIAVELLSSHTSGAPIVDDAGKFIGFVSEFDLLGAIEAGVNLSTVTADQIMNKDHFVADASTTVSDAIRLMKDKHLLILPVVRQGRIIYSVTRHDLLRARIGLGMGIEV